MLENIRLKDLQNHGLKKSTSIRPYIWKYNHYCIFEGQLAIYMIKNNSAVYTRLALLLSQKNDAHGICSNFAEVLVKESDAQFAGIYTKKKLSDNQANNHEFTLFADYPPQNYSDLIIKTDQHELMPDGKACSYNSDAPQIQRLPDFFPEIKAVHWFIPVGDDSFLHVITKKADRGMFSSSTPLFSSSDLNQLSLITERLSEIIGSPSGKGKSARKPQADPALDIFNRHVQAADNRFLKRILATVSHEIRNPFNLMNGYSNLLSETRLNDEQKHYLNVIKSSGESLFEVVFKALQFTNIYFRQVKIDPVSFSFNELLLSLEKVYAPLAQEKGIKYSCISQLERSDRFIADKTMIHYILSYLLSNALKFSNAGEITLDIKAIESTRCHDKLQFQITDTGKGFDLNNFKTMLQFFGQEDSSITRNYGGLGLGLSIANYYTELLGGTLIAESKPGYGSTFTVTLDLNRDYRELPGLLYDTLNIPPEITRKIKVLLVDDDPFQQKMGKVYLSDWNVTLAENGQQAIDFMEFQKFDIVLMDIRMPVMDGITTTIIIREKYGFDQKIVALSGEAIRESIDEALRAGMDGFISKPYDKDKLIFNILSTLDIDISKLSSSNPNSSFDLKGVAICESVLDPVILNAAGKASLMLANNITDAESLLKKHTFDFVLLQLSEGFSDSMIPVSFVRKFQPDATIIAMSDIRIDKSDEFKKNFGVDGIILQEELFTGSFFQQIKEIVMLRKLYPESLTEANDKVYQLSGIIKHIGNNPEAIKEIVETYLWFMPDHIKQFRQYSINHDARQLSNIAHSVKSIVKQFKINSILSQIEMLEHNTKNGLEEETINRMIDEVCNALELSIVQMKLDFGENK